MTWQPMSPISQQNKSNENGPGIDNSAGLWLVPGAGRFSPCAKSQKNATIRKAPRPMSTRAVAMLRSFQNKLTAHSEIFVRVTFGIFMGGLVVLLILLYADAPILGL
jgi:hypothetical protein